jgi:hypothetical protein
MVDTGYSDVPNPGDVVGNELGISMFPHHKKLFNYRQALELRSVDERAAQVEMMLRHPGVDITIQDPRYKQYKGPLARAPDGSAYPFPRTPQNSTLWNLNHHMNSTIIDWKGQHRDQHSHFVKLDETGGLFHDKISGVLPGGRTHEPSLPTHNYQPHLGSHGLHNLRT